jgi:hypothetical protein
VCVEGGSDEGVPFFSLSQMQMFLELSCIDLFSMDDNPVLFVNCTSTALPELFKGVIFRVNSLAWTEHPTIPPQIHGLWVHVHAVWCKAACGVSDSHVV